MRHFLIEVLDDAEQITAEKALDILTFAFRGEVLTVREIAPTARPSELCGGHSEGSFVRNIDRVCLTCGLPLALKGVNHD